MTITNYSFNYVKQLIFNNAGIDLDTGKEYLVESRLSRLARKSGCSSVDLFVSKLAKTSKYNLTNEHLQVIDAMTTNETSFFRDFKPFEALRKTIIPNIIKQKTRPLNIWCGACSSGQEPYSISMLVHENFPGILSNEIKIIASDISKEVLQRAKSGIYSQLEVNRGLPATLLIKYFSKKGIKWAISPKVRNIIEFKEVNLIKAWPMMPKMDIIFLRNVLIYFNIETKKQILKKMRQLLKPGGILFLGNAETTLNLDNGYEVAHIDKTVCYKKKI